MYILYKCISFYEYTVFSIVDLKGKVILTLEWLSLPQPNSTQPRVGLALFSYGKPQTKTKTKTTNRIPLYLSSYTTKLDQIQDATLFQPN